MKEWYLESRNPPNITSGYETDAISDYAQSNFTDVLLTGFSDTVILYNYDLTISQTIKAVIQKNTADTQLKSLERGILCPVGTLKAGMYIFFENRFWLINGYPGNNKCYEKATMRLCQYKLYWQNVSGEIISRWITVNSEKSSIGEKGNSYLVLDSNTFWITLPNDDEVSSLEDKRIFIDRNKVNSRKVFKIIKDNDIPYDYGEEHGGVADLLVEKVEFNSDTDKQITLPSGETVWIADYIEPVIPPEIIVDPTINFTATIIGSSELVVGRPKTYVVEFKDSNGNLINNVVFAWSVKSDFEAFITKTIIGKQIILQINTEDFIDEVFALRIIVGGKAISQLDIQVKGLF